MIRRSRLLLVLALCMAFAVTGIFAGGNANFTIGLRDYDDDAVWTDVDFDLASQNFFGADVDFGNEDWPVFLVAGIHVSSESDRDMNGEKITLAVVDVSFGVRWVANRGGNVHPYLSAGVASVGAALDTNDNDPFDGDLWFADETDQSLGLFFNGGVYWDLGERVNVGLDARWLAGTEMNFDIVGTVVDTDVDYRQIGMLVGFSW